MNRHPSPAPVAPAAVMVCTSKPADAKKGVLCTGDPETGTVPVDNVIGKARFIAWPPSRWGGVSSFDPQVEPQQG